MVGTSYTSGYISPDQFLEQREINRKIFYKYNEATLFDFLIHSGRKKESANTTYRHAELGYLFKSAIVESATGTAGAGNPVTVTLEEASHENTGTLSPGRVGALCMIGGIHGIVTAKNTSVADAHTLTIQPIDGGDIVTASTIGTPILFYSYAAGDGTGQPTSEARKPEWKYNYTQIFKTKYETYGSIAANKTEIEVEGKPYYWLQGVVDAMEKHKLEMEMAFILGVRSNVATASNGETIYTTGGLIWHILNDGGQREQYTVNSFAIADLEAGEKKLAKQRAAKEVMMLNGVNFNIEVDKLVRTTLNASGSGVNYEAFGKAGGKQAAVDFGFDAFVFNNRTYYKRYYDFLDYEPVTGYASAPYPAMGFVIPLDKIKSPTSDAQGSYDTICLRYKQGPEVGNRMMKHWVRDATITNDDKVEFNYLSEMGIEFAGVNQFLQFHL